MAVAIITRFIFPLFSVVLARGGNNEEWPYHEVVDREMKVQLYWKLEGNTITFQLETRTEGLVGFGLSSDGRLPGSDLVLGWTDKGKTSFFDYHADKHGKIALDKQQDYKLLSSFNKKGLTALRFSRKLDTCDPEDYAITTDTIKVIYTLSKNTPNSPSDTSFFQSLKWQEKSVKILRARVFMGKPPEDVKIWDVRVENFTIPGNRNSFYYCRVIRGPPLRRKHHLIKFEQVIIPENVDYVHHMSVFHCVARNREEGEEAVAAGPMECFQPYNPSLYRRCNTFLTATGKGSGGVIYPPEAGVPIGKKYPEYFLHQIHYENMMYDNGIVDNSGLRYYYTSKLRPYDASFMLMGNGWQDSFVIPPGQREFVVSGHSPPGCLAQAMPKEGINIFAIIIHTHAYGTKILVRHFRKNIELPPIAADMNYDFDFQRFILFPKIRKILPGDHVTVECTFDTSAINTTVVGGVTTADEMCMALPFYYPAINIGTSASNVNPAIVAGLTGLDYSTGRYNVTFEIGVPALSYRNYLLHYDWSYSRMCTIENALRFSPQLSLCYTADERKIQLPPVSYPEPVKQYRFPDSCNKNILRRLGGSTCSPY